MSKMELLIIAWKGEGFWSKVELLAISITPKYCHHIQQSSDMRSYDWMYLPRHQVYSAIERGV